MNFVPKPGPRSLKSLQQISESCTLRHKFGLSAGAVGRISRMVGAEWRPKTCQWIEGEPRDRNFCADAVQEDSSYCAAHHARCYVKVPPNHDG